MVMVATKVWTREEVLALPDDGNRYELIEGELLVSPAPRGRHQRGVFELALLLHPYVRAHRLGALMALPGDLDLQSPNLVQPDLFVGAMVDGREPVEWEEFGIPILVVEVLSPSTAQYDRVKKRRLYQRVGVPVYWIVDLDARLVEVWTPDADRPIIEDQQLSWQPDPEAPPLHLELPTYFRRVWGESGRA
jgi:Uma2 family endonuclease